MSIHTRLTLSLLCMLATTAQAREGCEREAPIDPDLPAGLAGRYRLVGATPEGHAYTGALTLALGDTRYTITRNTGGRATPGHAWFERCGPDRIRQLTVRLDARPVIEWICQVTADGGNDYRVTCAGPRDAQGRHGLEAWFRQP